MPILEKIEQEIQANHWTDSIPLEFHYTAGVAGEEFRRELRDNGKFLASKCPRCKTTYLPARMFCPTCFVETKERITVNKPGYVYSYTAASKDRSGNRAARPTVVALVKFEGVTGGLIHMLNADDPEKVVIGLKVTPVLKELAQRTGALTDIIYFIPTGTGPRKSLSGTYPSAEKEEDAGKARYRALMEMIDESGYPIGEEELTLFPIRDKIGKGERLSKVEDDFLHKLADRAREWHRGEKSSADTEPENTMSG